MSDRDVARLVVVVAAALHCDGEFLVMRRSPTEKGWPGHWELPGGKRRIDETCLAALAREVSEETGLALPQKAVSCHVFDYCSGLDDPDLLDRTQITFLAELPDKAPIVLSKEHAGSAWITPREIDQLEPMSAESRAALRAAARLSESC